MKTPTATYRLQITASQDLFRAAELVPYLRGLGVDWVYLSPVLRATSGSEHGYDVVDPTEVDPERGGEEGLRALSRAAHDAGLGVLVDIVPNHQGVAVPRENPWWWSLLREGRDSAYADAFDVDWAAGHGKILIPVLGDGDEDLAALRVEGETLRYYDNVYPIAPGTATPGEDPAAVHARQHYELIHWRRGDAELNYRRFFTITTLAGVRVEDPEVFERSHEQVAAWFRDGLVDGLRIDHPDGLRDPGGYLDALAETTGGAWTVVEKILEPGEQLPAHWRTAGTTGYDTLGWIDRVLTDPAGHYTLASLDTRTRGGEPVRWERLIQRTKRNVAEVSLAVEVNRLVRELPEGLGVAPEDARDALAEILAAFPVYRSYLPFGREHLDAAVAAARAARPELAPTLDVLAPVLAGEHATSSESESEAEAEGPGPWALRFQQTSGMVMAKGVEDNAFYRYPVLSSLTEVGGDPAVFSIDPGRFHELAAARQREWPAAMNTLTTHDTKRSAAVRARITVLAEEPHAWTEVLTTLGTRAREHGIELTDDPALNLVTQAIVGAWPIDRQRALDYALKAVREAGVSTAWVDGNEQFEHELTRYVDFVLDHPRARGLVEGFVHRIAAPGWSNALAATALELLLPGVPDVYQGQELWEPSLVDPDNRRPVDFAVRSTLLERLDAADAAGEPWCPPVAEDGAARFVLTARGLRLRREHPELFVDYTPVAVSGALAEHALGFDRGGAVCLITRLPVGLARAGGWGEERAELADGTWRDELTGRVVVTSAGRGVSLAEVFETYPVALLRRKEN